jgi:hypothetical protein
MTKIVADSVELNVKRSILDGFMSDMQKFRDIMPEQVEDWYAEKTFCSFSIKNLGKLGMQLANAESSGIYKFVSTESSKVEFVLQFRCTLDSDTVTGGSFEISAEMNPLVEMMTKRPLTNFVNILTNNLKQKIN